MSRNIKDYDGILTKFVFLNSMLILLMLSLVNIKSSDSILDLVKKVQTNGIGLIFASILTLLTNGIIKTDYKNIMVFWKAKQPLPSYRVFSHLVKNDHRIDYDEIKTKYNPLPLDPEPQSKLWYKLLKKYPDDEMILQSHRDYLMYRDLTAISFLLLTIYLIMFVLLKIFRIDISILLVIVFLAEYLVLLVAARTKAERFVLNVISCDLTSGVID